MKGHARMGYANPIHRLNGEPAQLSVLGNDKLRVRMQRSFAQCYVIGGTQRLLWLRTIAAS
jgi:hypothetical protein